MKRFGEPFASKGFDKVTWVDKQTAEARQELLERFGEATFHREFLWELVSNERHLAVIDQDRRLRVYHPYPLGNPPKYPSREYLSQRIIYLTKEKLPNAIDAMDKLNQALRARGDKNPWYSGRATWPLTNLLEMTAVDNYNLISYLERKAKMVTSGTQLENINEWREVARFPNARVSLKTFPSAYTFEETPYRVCLSISRSDQEPSRETEAQTLRFTVLPQEKTAFVYALHNTIRVRHDDKVPYERNKAIDDFLEPFGKFNHPLTRVNFILLIALLEKIGVRDIFVSADSVGAFKYNVPEDERERVNERIYVSKIEAVEFAVKKLAGTRLVRRGLNHHQTNFGNTRDELAGFHHLKLDSELIVKGNGTDDRALATLIAGVHSLDIINKPAPVA